MAQEPKFLEHTENGWQLKKEFADQLNDIANQKKALEKLEEPIKSGVKKEAKIYCPSGASLGAYDYQVTATFISVDFDENYLKEHYPDIYEKCCFPTYHKGQEKLAPNKRTGKEK